MQCIELYLNFNFESDELHNKWILSSFNIWLDLHKIGKKQQQFSSEIISIYFQN